MKQTVLFLSVAAAVMLIASPTLARGNRLDVGHIPPGNPDNAHVISISEAALPSHVAHGDRCPATDGLCTCNDGAVCAIVRTVRSHPSGISRLDETSTEHLFPHFSQPLN